MTIGGSSARHRQTAAGQRCTVRRRVGVVTAVGIRTLWAAGRVSADGSRRPPAVASVPAEGIRGRPAAGIQPAAAAPVRFAVGRPEPRAGELPMGVTVADGRSANRWTPARVAAPPAAPDLATAAGDIVGLPERFPAAGATTPGAVRPPGDPYDAAGMPAEERGAAVAAGERCGSDVAGEPADGGTTENLRTAGGVGARSAVGPGRGTGGAAAALSAAVAAGTPISGRGSGNRLAGYLFRPSGRCAVDRRRAPAAGYLRPARDSWWPASAGRPTRGAKSGKRPVL